MSVCSVPCRRLIGEPRQQPKKFYNIDTDAELRAGANVIKLFTVVSHKFLLQARAFVPGKPFQLSLMFVSKDRSLP